MKPVITQRTPIGNFAITTVEELFDTPRSIPEKCMAFEILWITSGEGTLSLDMHHHALCPNTIYTLAPGQVKRITPSRELKGYYLQIDTDLMHIIHDQSDVASMIWQAVGNKVPVAIADEAIIGELNHILETIHRACQKTFSARPEILRSYLKILLIYISREFTTASRQGAYDRNLEIVKKFVTLVKEKIADKKLVNEYADDLCITPGYLNMIVKRYTGLTASQHIQQHIISEAKRHAVYSGMRMKEIAINLGFFDQAHFSKYFKTYSGINFTDFRRTVGIAVHPET